MITKFKLFENIDYDKNFNIGDVVICINDEEATYEMKKMNKYIITGIMVDLIQLRNYNSGIIQPNSSIGNWFKDRFIKEKDLEKWEMNQISKKYNL